MKKVLKKLIPAKFRKTNPVVPVVRLKGVISAGGNAFNPALSLASCAEMLEKAFKNKEAPAVAISVNSPGGSPVQSRLIFRRIRDLAEEHNKKVLVFTEDAAASGGYMIAVAGDEIIADPSSIIGSIGVISSGFGFVEAIDKLGIERRVYTAGQNKSTLDPFQPAKKEDIERIKELQLEIHDVFIDLVKSRRADKLSDNPDIFTGRFWAGQKAKELGLVDEIGDMRSFLKARFGPKTELKLITPQRGLFGRRQPSATASLFSGVNTAQLLADMLEGAMHKLDERGYWSRLGL